MTGGPGDAACAPLLLLGFGGLAGLATLTGGLIALALGRRRPLLLCLSAGAILGVALLELMPEAVRAEGDAAAATLGVYAGLGLVSWLILDRLRQPALGGAASLVRHLGPASLTLHSVMDGLAIGVAFQASERVGLAIASAVIIHDLCDGANTVNLGLTALSPGPAFRWLAADAVAPILGLLLAHAIAVPRTALGPILSLFAGSFLYIGAGKLAAEGYRGDPGLRSGVAVLAGFGLIYGVVHLSARL